LKYSAAILKTLKKQHHEFKTLELFLILRALACSTKNFNLLALKKMKVKAQRRYFLYTNSNIVTMPRNCIELILKKASIVAVNKNGPK
jgi:hypothetical protein